MEAKHLIAFEYKKDDRTYELLMPNGAPLGEAYEAASTFVSKIAEMINDHSKSLQPKDPDEDQSDEKKDESD